MPTDVKAYRRRMELACDDKFEPRLEVVALRCKPPPYLELFEKLLYLLLFDELLSFWLVLSRPPAPPVSVFFIRFLLTVGGAL